MSTGEQERDPEGLERAPDGLHEAPQEALERPAGAGGAVDPAEAVTPAERASEAAEDDAPAGAVEPGRDADGTAEDDVPEDSLGAPSLDAALEAVLLVTDQPLDVATLAALVRRPADDVRTRLEVLAAGYTAAARGFDLREAAGGWRFYTRAECAEVVERYVRDGQQARLTQAALETLAVVAYRQPVSRARISAIRGVNVDGVIRTLTTRGLVAEAGHDESSGAILYRTTDLFLERLGLTSLEELPPVADFLPDIEMLDDFVEQTSS